MKAITTEVEKVVAGVVAGKTWRAWVEEGHDSVYGTDGVAVLYYDHAAEYMEDEENTEVGKGLQKALNAAGFETEWNGDPLYVVEVKGKK